MAESTPFPTRRGLMIGAGAIAAAATLPVAAAAPDLAPAVAPQGPLTLAELKDLSERAVPILRKHFPMALGDVFMAEAGENYHGLCIQCDCPERADRMFRCNCQFHPLAGTPMTGGMSGYYEPEWDERTTYEVLDDVLRWSGKPETMTDAEWVEALALTDMTPDSHAEFLADMERSIAEMDQAPLAAEPAR